MGNTFEVNVWRRDTDGKYYNHCVYRGESLAAALWTMFGCRKKYGCITLEWRPVSASVTQEK